MAIPGGIRHNVVRVYSWELAWNARKYSNCRFDKCCLRNSHNDPLNRMQLRDIESYPKNTYFKFTPVPKRILFYRRFFKTVAEVLKKLQQRDVSICLTFFTGRP